MLRDYDDDDDDDDGFVIGFAGAEGEELTMWLRPSLFIVQESLIRELPEGWSVGGVLKNGKPKQKFIVNGDFQALRLIFCEKPWGWKVVMWTVKQQNMFEGITLQIQHIDVATAVE